MKLNFRAVLNNLMVIIARNPIEIIISVAFFTLSLLTYEGIMSTKTYGDNLFLAPLIFALSYVLNRLFSKGPIRIIYFLSVLSVAIPFLVNATEWVFSGGYLASVAITVAVIAVYSNFKDNKHFVKNILVYAKELLFTMIIVAAIYAVLMATIFSIIYLFDLFKNSSNDIAYYTTCLCGIILAPLTFLYLNSNPDNNREEFRITRIFEVVIRYILTPALIIYTTILYLYIVKIVIAWSLPKGNLAYMVFAFIISAIVIKACISLVNKPIFPRFFSSFSIIAIAPLVLFWTGAIHRVSQYGFTEERVYLIVCGAIMTLAVLLFISRKYDKYIYVGYITIVLLSLFSYIKPISAKEIGIRSQMNQLQTLAKDLKMMGDDGKLTAPPQPCADSVSKAKFERLNDIYTYLAKQTDKSRLKELYGYSGVTEIRTDFGKQFLFNSSNKDFVKSRTGKFSTMGYRWVDTDVTALIAGDTMQIMDSRGNEIFSTPLSMLESKLTITTQPYSIAVQIDPTTHPGTAQPADSLLQFDFENYRVIFSRISFGKDGGISKATVKALLIK
ncbi:MAG: DUF4153 domain-containing protein [Rikenellaceae bacterium]